MISIDELLKLLGITEKDAEATRLVDGVVPAVHFVDLGANGEGENGFLVKKGRKTMLGKLTRDENGSFEFVKKSATGEESPIKLSASNKAALVAMVDDQKSKIGELEKALEGAEEDDSAEDMPEAIKTILGGMAKAFEPEAPAAGAPADPTAADDGKAVDDSQKSATDDPEPDPVPAADGAFTIGETVVTGELAKYAEGLTKTAGEQMKDPEFAGALEQQIAGMAALQSKIDPGQAMATVSKRMDDRFTKLEQENADLRVKLDAMAAAGGLPGLTVPDGVPTPAPTQKGAKKTGLIPAGQDLAKYASGDGPDFDINPQG